MFLQGGNMLDEFRKRPIPSAVAAVIGVLAIINGVPPAVDQNLPWFAQRFQGMSEWLPSVVVALVIGPAVYFGLQYGRYRSALRKVVRDYMVDVADRNTQIDPEHYGPMSDGVKRGEESADPEWGNKILAKYGLPPEKEYC
jgi:hypothetical protein